MAAVRRVGRARVVLFVAVLFLRHPRYVWCMYTTSSRGARIGARRPPRRDVRAAGGTDEHEAMYSGYTSSFLDRSGTNTLWSLPGDELTSLMRTRVLHLHGEILGIPTLLYTETRNTNDR